MNDVIIEKNAELSFGNSHDRKDEKEWEGGRCVKGKWFGEVQENKSC